MTRKNIPKVNDLHTELVLILKATTNGKYPALAEATHNFFKISFYLSKNTLAAGKQQWDPMWLLICE